MESILDVMRRHPNYDPAHGHYEDMPTNEEVWAANTIGFDEMVELGILSDTIVDGSVTRTKEQKWHDIVEKYGHSGAVSNDDIMSEIELEQAELVRRTRDAGIPTRYESVPLEVTYIDDMLKGKGVYLYGAQGSGKTWRACAMLRGWLSKRPEKALFITAVELTVLLRETYGSQGSLMDLMRTYTNVGMLVIDDFDKANPSIDTLMFLFGIIDGRNKYLRPTIVTTQYDVGDLMGWLARNGGDAYASAIASRFSDESFIAIDMGDVDHRLGQ